MPLYRVELQRYVDEKATVEIEATDEIEAQAKAHHAPGINWQPGDEVGAADVLSVDPVKVGA